HAPVVGPWLHQRARRVGKKLFGDSEDAIRNGNWWGNDTVWRMCLDLNKIAAYGDADGHLRDGMRPKRHIALVDGILAGEGRGPMNPDPVAAGIVVFGQTPAAVDAACAYLIGFDPERIPLVRESFRCKFLPIADGQWRDVVVRSNCRQWNGQLN